MAENNLEHRITKNGQMIEQGYIPLVQILDQELDIELSILMIESLSQSDYQEIRILPADVALKGMSNDLVITEPFHIVYAKLNIEDSTNKFIAMNQYVKNKDNSTYLGNLQNPLFNRDVELRDHQTTINQQINTKGYVPIAQIPDKKLQTELPKFFIKKQPQKAFDKIKIVSAEIALEGMASHLRISEPFHIIYAQVEKELEKKYSLLCSYITNNNIPCINQIKFF